MKKLFYFFGVCWKNFDGYKFKFAVCFLLKLLRMVTSVVVPLFFSTLITAIINRNSEAIKEALIIIVALGLLEIIISYVSSKIEIHIKKNVNYIVKTNLFNKLLFIPQHKLSHINEGRLFSLITSDASVISSYIFFLVNSWLSIINIVTIGIIIFNLNWILSLIILVSYPIIYLINNFYGKKIKENAIMFNKESDDFIGFYKNIITNFDELKNRNHFDSIDEIYMAKNLTIKNLAYKQENMQNNKSLFNSAIGIVNHTLFLIIGAIFVVKDMLSLGLFVSFNTYLKNFSSSLNNIVNLNSNIQPNLVTLERIEEIERIYSDTLKAENEKVSVDIITGDIVFSDVVFSFGSKEIFDKVSIMFEENKKTAIVGKNGSGKTTLVNLVTGKYMPKAGVITINGVDITKYRYHDLQKNIAYVRQQPNLYYMSIRDNLLMFDNSKSFNQNDLERVCSLVGVLDDINTMPDGFDTVISDKVQLSVGQTQKIQIARVLLQNAPIIIFDEVTANLDNQTREGLLYIIKTQLKNKTIIFITHKENELLLSDCKYKIENKKLLEI